jgi:superfamily II RNA helicase
LHYTPDKSPTLAQSENDSNGFKDEDLARLLDSPAVIARCDTTSNFMPAAQETAKARDSPDMGSSICSNNLEIPRPDTPEGLTEAASRFFQKTDTNKEKDAPRQPSTEPRSEHVFPHHETSFTENHNPEETRVPSNETAWTRKQEEPAVVIEPRLERVSEVDPSLYQPPPYRHRADPIVHHLSIHNRPKSVRQKILVKELFSSPLHKLWLSKFDTFNHLQSEVANTLAHSDDSIVVSAPTGAGKTALFEIAMARFFAADLAHHGRYGTGQVSNQRKIVYVAPSKALCEERYEDWTRRLSDIDVGIQCAMITGDAEPGDSFRDVAAANVILTTPEKWDSLTRRWTENVFLFGTVKLLMVDEVHLLGDGTRGCCLESIVCRMKTIQRAATAASANYDAHRMSR